MPPNAFICAGRQLVARMRRAALGSRRRRRPGGRRAISAILSALSLCRSIRTASVLSPRSTRKRVERARAPHQSSSGRRAISSPRSRCAGDDHAADHVAVPAGVLGRRMHDDVSAERRAAVAGRASRRCCRPRATRRHRARRRRGHAMSATPSSGLLGVSIQISLVLPGCDRGRDRLDLVDRSRGVVEAPRLEDRVEQAGRCRRRHRSGMTTWSPGEQVTRTSASSAAIPDANATARSPNSSAAKHRSSALRVGFAVREYS